MVPQNDLTSTLKDQVCFALYSTSRAFTAAYRPLLEPLGLTYPQYLVLLVLWERDRLSVQELGEALQLDSGTLSPLLRRMETGDLLCRHRASDDERRVEVELTAHGRVLQREAARIPGQLAAESGIDPRRWAELCGTLQELNQALRAHSAR
ncbi:MarR family winged helix-turn-helix transcriptional regulator [Psychromicrobium xiongbiense]|uniref:MarR family winged helix-turn-helix transcriptional regulator n=1 Tax=Psychromicrobium xiongbiense TaxID=3051184 RepID=UPI00255266DE|nr:MarR family transcriptional regulator [Psychromicrobium sp. YIM S02556]